ncbi:MAG: metallophosphoesterase family protein [Chloroflexi bacterium]|nr:metallophosphoesterase family protein [Chloroflexota bacterium]
MRILIFSDLHANLEALMALQHVEPQPDALFFLGDAVGYGPDPLVCMTWLKNNATVWVQGDHDAAAATGADCVSPEEWLQVAHATRRINRTLLPHPSLVYLGALSPTAEREQGGARFWLTHRAGPRLDVLTASHRALEKAFDGIAADVILSGHTHVPLLRRVGQRWLVNPGSLGQPRHGLPSCTYAVWNDGDLKIQHIDYDPRATIQKLALLPLDPEHVVRLQETLRVGM